MVHRGRVVAWTLFLLESFATVSSLLLFWAFALNGPFRSVRLELSEWGVATWDIVLSLVFFLQHSGMARKGFQAFVSHVIQPCYYRTLFVLVSGLLLTIVMICWQPSGIAIFKLEGAPRTIMKGLSFAVLIVIVWSRRILRSADPLLGDPTEDCKPGASPAPSQLVVSGPYSVVRHPLYSSLIALIWLHPDLTVDRLLFNILWTVWIYIGTTLEEKDLLRDFGEAYSEYQQTTPMLIPFSGGLAGGRGPR
jgi:hypothetical protein